MRNVFKNIRWPCIETGVRIWEAKGSEETSAEPKKKIAVNAGRRSSTDRLRGNVETRSCHGEIKRPSGGIMACLDLRGFATEESQRVSPESFDSRFLPILSERISNDTRDKGSRMSISIATRNCKLERFACMWNAIKRAFARDPSLADSLIIGSEGIDNLISTESSFSELRISRLDLGIQDVLSILQLCR